MTRSTVRSPVPIFFVSSTREQIAAELCVYTNSNFTMHQLDVAQAEKEEGAAAATPAKEEEGKETEIGTEGGAGDSSGDVPAPMPGDSVKEKGDATEKDAQKKKD